MNDLRLALRQMLKAPGFTLLAVLTLGLGVGVNTSMFTALQHLLMRELPYPEPDRLVQLFRSSPGSPRESHHSTADFLDYQEAGSSFETVAAMNDRQFNLSETGRAAERIGGLQVTSGFFAALGIQPLLGRTFTEDEDRPGRNQVVVLDHGFWQGRFAADPDIIGRQLRLDGESVTVIGVMPPSFHDPLLMGPAFLWRPIAFTDTQRANRGMQYLKCLARLRPGVSLRDGQANLAVTQARLAQENGRTSANELRLEPLAESSLPPQARRIVWSIMMLAGFVLLIACVNLANLELARASLRARELAVRATLGAGRTRLVVQMLTASMVLALLGGLFGLLLAWLGNEVLARQFVFERVRVLTLDLNWRVFLFSLGIASVAGLAFGLVPAWLAARTEVNVALQKNARGNTGDRSQRRLQQALIVAQMALALVLLSGAGLVIDGLSRFRHLNPGWNPAGITMGILTLPESKYGSAEARQLFASRLLDHLGAQPDVRQVALAWNLPLRQFNVTSSFQVDGVPTPPGQGGPRCSVNGVTPGYFEILGMRLQAGRDFGPQDTADHPSVVIINEAMARAFWPDRSPIGLRLGNEEIIGVVNNVTFPGNPAERRTPYQTYRPNAQAPGANLTIAARGGLSGAALQKAVAQLDPDQPVGQAGPVMSAIDLSLNQWGLAGRILIGFAVLGVSLAALGVYGVVSGSVARRRNEIGLRIALGAQMRDVLWLVLRMGLRLAGMGAVLGLLGAAGLTRLIASALHALPPGSPAVLAALTLLLILITAAACWLPARRAARTDPIEALRSE